MATVEHPLIYDELIDLLAESASPDKLLQFQLSDDNQQRLDALLSKNRDGSLSASESAELDSFEHFEHVVRMLKARVRERQGS
jgi:hypothetical protein